METTKPQLLWMPGWEGHTLLRTSEPCKVLGSLAGVGGPHVELTVLQVARDLQELNCVCV